MPYNEIGPLEHVTVRKPIDKFTTLNFTVYLLDFEICYVFAMLGVCFTTGV